MSIDPIMPEAGPADASDRRQSRGPATRADASDHPDGGDLPAADGAGCADTPGTGARAATLELRGSADGLLDEPFALRVRGAGPGARVVWRARYRDDDGRVWRAAGLRCDNLATDWSPGKDGTGDVAALRSLRPVSIDLRVETADGRAATRTVTRLLAGDGVRTRRWRDGLAATLHVPAVPACATAIVDASGSDAQATAAALAAPLLASRGVLVLVLAPARGRTFDEQLETARERLSAVPGAAGSEAVVLSAHDPFSDTPPAGVVMPPGVGLRERDPGAARVRAGAWDELLARLGATPRARP
jgi:hypothetical protein